MIMKDYVHLTLVINVNIILIVVNYRNSCERLGFEILTEPRESENLNNPTTDAQGNENR